MPGLTPMPLERLPQSVQDEVSAALLSPTPPPRYKTFGVDGRPFAQITSRAWYEWHRAQASTPGTPKQLRRMWNHLSPALRPILLQRDGDRCLQCGAGEPEVRIHIDHITPLAKGGTNALDNLQVLCQPCNQRKWAH